MSNKKVEETEEKVVSIEDIKNEEIVEEKPYKFNELEFDHIFPMIALIDKIGLNKVLGLMENKAILNLFQGKKPMKLNEEGIEVVDQDEYVKEVGVAVVAITQLLFSSLKNCRNELYEVLSSVSNLSVEEVSKLKLKYVSSMIKDFIKLDGFKDFFKGVLESMEK